MTSAMSTWLRAVPILAAVALAGPLLAGLWGTLAPAAGHLPAAGLQGPSLAAIRALLAWPGLADAVRLSVVTGLVSTVVSLLIVMLLLAGWTGTRAFARLQRLLSPILALPHAAAAFGLAFLLAPSGWLARLVSPWLTGWNRPPDLLVPGDPAGLALIAGLVAKETPFLLLMAIAALPQSQAPARQRAATGLGYCRSTGWLKAVLPSIYAQIRLPIYAVLAYGMSTVDVALILGPSTPPPLSVQILTWMHAPDLAARATAAAGAVLQALLVAATILAWHLSERVVGWLGRLWAEAGGRGARVLDGLARGLGLGLGALIAAAVLAGLASLGLWSIAGFWSFPDPLPQTVGLGAWQAAAPDLRASVWTTLLIAAVSVAAALAIALACLEAGARAGHAAGSRLQWLIFLPLLIPQTAFLPGLQTLLIAAGLDTGLAPVIVVHLAFVLPYIVLSLSEPWQAWDSRYGMVAAGLGRSPASVFWQIRLPMLLRPVLTAAAVGLAVSVGLYLPTLLVGGGRVSTLTTEAVALAAGGDRRAIGVWSIAQTAAAVVPFALALALPSLVWRNRRGLHG